MADKPKELGLFISTAPSDPEEKKKWAHQMLRIQVAMWVDEGATCLECKKPYANVDDFLARNPKRGKTKEFSFVDTACWDAYVAKVS